jgi:hypothetical protein
MNNPRFAKLKTNKNSVVYFPRNLIGKFDVRVANVSNLTKDI